MITNSNNKNPQGCGNLIFRATTMLFKMSCFQQKLWKHANKQERVAHLQEKEKKAMNRIAKEGQMLDT